MVTVWPSVSTLLANSELFQITAKFSINYSRIEIEVAVKEARIESVFTAGNRN
jgi:hypothetical protein